MIRVQIDECKFCHTVDSNLYTGSYTLTVHIDLLNDMIVFWRLLTFPHKVEIVPELSLFIVSYPTLKKYFCAESQRKCKIDGCY